jgi:hypothetical protein
MLFELDSFPGAFPVVFQRIRKCLCSEYLTEFDSKNTGNIEKTSIHFISRAYLVRSATE